MRQAPENQPSVGGPEVPRHVAFIMDGNGRWAQRRGLPRLEGHRMGVDRIQSLVEALDAKGVRFVTIYAFSTENWARPKEEVEGLIGIFSAAIEVQTQILHEKNVRIVHVGKTANLSPELGRAIAAAQELTGANTGVTLNVAFDYGGRDEIIDAVRRIIRDGLGPDEVDEETFSRYLFTAHCPDPDLIIRTAGRAAHQQLPALAVGLQRVLPYSDPVAGPGARRVGPGPGSLRQPPAALRPGSRI